jgi:hypothetical protein
LKEVLAREGIEGQILDTAELGPGRANFYARLKGNGKKKAIALVHHMDVVPVTDSQWTVPAFQGLVKDGYVYGRGAIDMKGHGIIQLMAMVAIKRSGMQLDRDLVYIANADEEVNGDGAIIFVKRHPDLLQDVEYLLTEGADTRVEGGKVRWFGIDVGEKRPLDSPRGGRKDSHGSVPIGDQNPVPNWRGPSNEYRPGRHRCASLRRWSAVLQGARHDRDQSRRPEVSGRSTHSAPVTGRAGVALSEPERNALLRNTISRPFWWAATRPIPFPNGPRPN